MYEAKVTDFTSNFKKFIEEQIKPSNEKALTIFVEDEDDSGLYDIAYDMKVLIENNEFKPFGIDGRAFDEWYDLFIESDILPILKQIASERTDDYYRKHIIILCKNLIRARFLYDNTRRICSNLIDKVNRRLLSISLKDGRELIFTSIRERKDGEEELTFKHWIPDEGYDRYLERYDAEQIATKRTAKQILQIIKDNNKYGWTKCLDCTCHEIAEQFGVEVEDGRK